MAIDGDRKIAIFSILPDQRWGNFKNFQRQRNGQTPTPPPPLSPFQVLCPMPAFFAVRHLFSALIEIPWPRCRTDNPQNFPDTASNGQKTTALFDECPRFSFFGIQLDEAQVIKGNFASPRKLIGMLESLGHDKEATALPLVLIKAHHGLFRIPPGQWTRGTQIGHAAPGYRRQTGRFRRPRPKSPDLSLFCPRFPCPPPLKRPGHRSFEGRARFGPSSSHVCPATIKNSLSDN